MIRKFLLLLSLLFVILVSSLSILKYTLEKENFSRYKFLSEVLLEFSYIPANTKIFFSSLLSKAEPYSAKENCSNIFLTENVESIDNLNFSGKYFKDDTYIIISSISDNKSKLKIINLKNNQVLFSFDILLSDLENLHSDYLQRNDSYVWDTNKRFTPKYLTIRHPLLLDDKIIFSAVGPLWVIDKNKKISLFNDKYFYHHSKELDSNGNIWVPGYVSLNEINEDNVELFKQVFGQPFKDYRFDAIIQLDQSGNILYKKAIAEIFYENKLKSVIFGSGSKFDKDPMHLNDIQPVFRDSKYFKKGDLLLSIKNQSSIVHYRPTSNKIIKIIKGDFIMQHDVNVISDNEISIFNNYHLLSYKNSNEMLDKNHNSMLIYDYSTGAFKEHAANIFKNHNIRTSFQGRGEILEKNKFTFIESTEQGCIVFIDDNKHLYSSFVNINPKNNKNNFFNWTRVIQRESDIKSLKKFIE
jgi:hypothetical protein